VLAGWRPSGTHRPGLAGCSGDRGGAALGDGLLDGVDTLQDGADLGDDLGEVDLADARHGGQQPGLGVANQAGGEGAVEVGDGAKQGPKQPDLSADQLGQRLWCQAQWWGWGCAQPGEQLGGAAAAAVGMPAAEGRQADLAEPGGCLRRRIGLQEGQGDLGGQSGEDLLGAGPVSIQQGAELVAGGGLGLDVVLAQPDQGLQLAGGIVQGIESAQPVAVGAQVVGQLVAVARVGLGPCRAPAGSGSMERAGMDRHHRVAGGQEPVDDQPAGLLDRHRQLVGLAVAGQPDGCVGQSSLGVRRCPLVDHGAGIVEDGHVMGGAGPVPANKHRSRSCSR
jgi:hypothetical protein